MKKSTSLISCLCFIGALAQGQTQTAPSTGARVNSGPTVRSPATAQPTSPQERQTVNSQIDANGNRVILTPTTPAFGATNSGFGATNSGFAATNSGFAATNSGFAATNLSRFGTNAPPFGVGTNTINEASGAANPAATGLTNAATLADQAFTQQLRAALARPTPTQIFFPQTRSTITVMNQNGVVTLQGFVANEGERTSIEARIKGTPGVTSVNNQLQIADLQNRGARPLFNQSPGDQSPGAETNRQLLNP